MAAMSYFPAFIDECRQKAWGAACHADWISKGVDDIMAHYQKLQPEDRALEEAIRNPILRPRTISPTYTSTSDQEAKLLHGRFRMASAK
jgi:hypothetical protein